MTSDDAQVTAEHVARAARRVHLRKAANIMAGQGFVGRLVARVLLRTAEKL